MRGKATGACPVEECRFAFRIVGAAYVSSPIQVNHGSTGSPHEHASCDPFVLVPGRGMIIAMPVKLGIVGAALAVPLLIASAPFAAASPRTPQNGAWNVNLQPRSEERR